MKFQKILLFSVLLEVTFRKIFLAKKHCFWNMFRRGYLGQSSRGTKRIGTPKLWKFMKKCLCLTISWFLISAFWIIALKTLECLHPYFARKTQKLGSPHPNTKIPDQELKHSRLRNVSKKKTYGTHLLWIKVKNSLLILDIVQRLSIQEAVYNKILSWSFSFVKGYILVKDCC